ncbi:GAF domain-containing protein [Candidatus Gracilibacteria bacterium]|nr:GAF domain-containing protein [Candidatus Gracilibacteria bacterium]
MATCGVGNQHPAEREGLYLPLNGSRRTIGVLGVRAQDRRRLLNPDQVHLLETFASQTALAIERAGLAEEAEQATVAAETERLRAALLSSVSHDLRTPLAIISGALSSLAEDEVGSAVARQELARNACDEAQRLNRLLANLLEMTRLEAGALRVRKSGRRSRKLWARRSSGGAKARRARSMRTRSVSCWPTICRLYRSTASWWSRCWGIYLIMRGNIHRRARLSSCAPYSKVLRGWLRWQIAGRGWWRARKSVSSTNSTVAGPTAHAATSA